jgi:heme/copper-type cytochrome/quinol oxidase subunit 2
MENNHEPIPTSAKKRRLYAIIMLLVIAGMIGIGALIYQSGYLSSDNSSTTQDSSYMKATCASLALVTNSTSTNGSSITSSFSGSATASGSVSTAINSTSNSETISTSSHVYFLIVESDPPGKFAGMNGSANLSAGTNWPVLHVQKGQVVTIHVLNCASSEPHGFAIDHYFNSGLTAEPGGSYFFTFTASQTGTFRVYCNVFCAIHPLMQNGELIVS